MQRARTGDQKDQRKSALLDAALDEFFERGFSAARMDDIARRAGLSKGAIYLYFDSKEDLFRSLIELHTKPRVEMITKLTEAADSFQAGLKALVGIAPTLIRDSKIPRLLKVLIGDASNFPDSVRLYRTCVVERVLSAMTHLIERADASDEIAAPNPDLTARVIVAPVVLAMIWRIVFETNDPDAEMDLQAYFEEHLRMVERSLMTKKGHS